MSVTEDLHKMLNKHSVKFTSYNNGYADITEFTSYGIKFTAISRSHIGPQYDWLRLSVDGATVEQVAEMIEGRMKQ